MTNILAVLIMLIAAAGLLSGPSSPFQAMDKAAYADPNTVNFVRPGLVLTIAGATVAADGTLKVRFKIADPRGLPLDREGIETPGPVSVSFIAAHIPPGQNQYVAYTTRIQTSTISNRSATQAAADSGGTFTKVAPGDYEYTFRTKLPAGFHAGATHTIAAYASRNLTEFDLGTNYHDTVFHFLPNGGPVTAVREVVQTKSCNKCHDPLALHGGARRSVEVCVTCHTPQTVDPDTGNSVNFPVMVHKIHMGADLPSVKAGSRYQIIGFGNSVHDYSTVKFPADARNCQACHEPGSKQSDNWLKPSRAACGACHDDVNFATGEGHVDLPQVSDNQCASCHVPEGELEFDASIKGAHTIPRLSKTLPGTVFELVRVDDGVAGKRPTVSFRVREKGGKPILPREMTALALVLSGPTADYSGYVREDVRTAEGSADGTYYWTFQNPIAPDAKGSYSVGIEGYRNVKLLEGTKQEMTVRDAGQNKVLSFAVDGSRVQARRTVVALEKCNQCHASLSLHGNNRNNPEQCVLCHTPNLTDVARRPASELPAATIDFRTLIHRIHSGEELGKKYEVYGFGSTKFDFSEVRFPGDRRNCRTCHVNESQQLPLPAGLLPVKDPRGLVESMGPETAACTGCHASTAAASHALANTTMIGESCAVCHGRGAEFSVDRVHAR